MPDELPITAENMRLQRRALGILADEVALLRTLGYNTTTGQYAATEADPVASAHMRAAEQRRKERVAQ
jgi:hypothetical protein